MTVSALAVLLAVSAVSPKGAVATAHPLASQAGASLLRSGGNAVDAAVAAAFALGVVEPRSSGIGGGGFALVYLARENRVVALDFREVAPRATTPTLFLPDGKPRQDLANEGALSVAVPAAVRGYADLVARFGRRPLAQVIAPAARLATQGFQVGISHVRALHGRLACLRTDPEASRIFLTPGDDGPSPPEPGERLRQPDLARTLLAIGQKGPDAFYKGPVAERIVRTLTARGGILTLSDLAAVKTRERVPLEGSYRGHRVVTMPPPSAGGLVLLGLLAALEGEDPHAGGYHPEKFLHVMIEAEKRLFVLRQKLGDPAFNPGADAQVRALLRPEAIRALRAGIGEQATPAPRLVAMQEHKDTTNISVIDAEGNAVALTTTVNDSFGSCVVARGTGVVLNDQMDDFAIAPGTPNAYGLMGGSENAPGPGKVPLSSMSPTFVFTPRGRLLLALGSAGGSTIPTSVAQTILHVVDDGMPIDRALAAPRLHHNLFPDEVRAEPDALDAATVRALQARGHQVHVAREPRLIEAPDQSMFDTPWGTTTGVEVDPQTGWREAAADPRRDGGGAIP